MTTEGEALLHAQDANGANSPLNRSHAPTNEVIFSSYGSTTRMPVRIDTAAPQVHHDPPETQANRADRGQYPVVGWDVTDTAGLGYHICFRSSPWHLLLRDFRWVFGNIGLVPWLVLPATYAKKKWTPLHILALVGQVVMLIVSLAITVALIVGAVASIPPVIVAVGVLLLFIYIAEKAQGSITRVTTSPEAVGADKEVWFFVNGVMTTGTGSEDISKELHRLFKRPIISILNRSLGLWFDLVECILQRDLLLITRDIRVGYKTVRKAVLDTSKDRIVIIGHSQGGIITSAWIDMLLTDVPQELLSRVEVYTFASAANHFSRPAADASGKCQSFAHVEHFANEHDFVAQFGVLGYAPLPGSALGPGDDPNDPVFDPCTPITPSWNKDDPDHGHDDKDVHVAYDPSRLSLKEKLKRADPFFESQTEGEPFVDAIGDFGGRIFLRRGHSGHLMGDHYINPSDSILDDPFVRKHSQIVTYLGGKNVKTGDSAGAGKRPMRHTTVG